MESLADVEETIFHTGRLGPPVKLQLVDSRLAAHMYLDIAVIFWLPSFSPPTI